MKRIFIRIIHAFMHRWEYQWWKQRSVYFYTRKCRVCGREEIKYIGARGDNKWHDVTEKWIQEDEKKRWMESEKCSDPLKD